MNTREKRCIFGAFAMVVRPFLPNSKPSKICSVKKSWPLKSNSPKSRSFFMSQMAATLCNGNELIHIYSYIVLSKDLHHDFQQNSIWAMTKFGPFTINREIVVCFFPCGFMTKSLILLCAPLDVIVCRRSWQMSAMDVLIA